MSTGRKCDGYEVDGLWKEVNPGLQKDTMVIHLYYHPTSSPSTSEVEKRHFYFFGSITVNDLAGFVDSEFWTHAILKATHIHPAIWHASVALGALHQKFLKGMSSSVLGTAFDEDVQFALKQYNKSIQFLTHLSGNTRLTTNHDRIITLTSCVLFVCISSLQGNEIQAFVHIRNGLRLFREWKLFALARQPQHSLDSPVSAGCLAAIFSRLDTQARTLLDGPSRETWGQHPVLPANTSQPFVALWHVYQELEYLLNGLVHCVQRVEFMLMRSYQCIKFRLAEEERSLYSGYFKAWDARFVEYLDMNKGIDHSKPVLVLHIRRTLADIVLRMDPHAGESGWDVFQSECNHILHLASKVLGEKGVVSGAESPKNTLQPCDYSTQSTEQSHQEQQEQQEKTAIPSFSISGGVVEPLYIVASRCRDSITRRRAIRLLKQYPRREGIWESTLVARIADEIVKIEESHKMGKEVDSDCPCLTRSGTICESHRVRDVNLVFLGERIAKVGFRTVEDLERKWPGKQVYLQCS